MSEDPHPDNELPAPEFPIPDAPTDVPVEPAGEPVPPESIGKPDDHEATIALAALKAGKPLQAGVPEDARVEDFKPES